MREANPELHRQRVSESLRGKLGEDSRRWRGVDASYVAIHMWIKKHWGVPDHCDMCHRPDASRYEWCNKDKKYRRVREDWFQLCPSCHRLYDFSIIREQVYGGLNFCKHGHNCLPKDIYINPSGHRECRICRAEAQRRYRAKNNKV